MGIMDGEVDLRIVIPLKICSLDFFRGIDPHIGQANRVPMDAHLPEDQDAMQKKTVTRPI